MKDMLWAFFMTMATLGAAAVMLGLIALLYFFVLLPLSTVTGTVTALIVGGFVFIVWGLALAYAIGKWC